MFKPDLEMAEESEIKLPTSIDHQKSKRISEKHLHLLYWLGQSLWLCGPQQTEKFWKRWAYQTTLQCLLRNLYAGQEATVRTGHRITYWFQIRKGVHQGWILSCCLFNFYAEYIMWHAGLDESPAEIKIARRNINNLRYGGDTTLMAENEEELKSL